MAKKKASGKTASLPRRFEFDDGTSSKFWEAIWSGTSVTVTFGRIGTDGQSRTSEFSDSTSAESDFEKRIRSKVSNGYVEIGPQHKKLSPPKGEAAKSTTQNKPTKKRKMAKTPNGLTDTQLLKLRRLVKSKDIANVKMAIQLLRSTAATSDDWSAVFSSTTISLLVNTWDFAVWKPICAEFVDFPSLLATFRETVTVRFAKATWNTQTEILSDESILGITPELMSIVKPLIKTSGIGFSFYNTKPSVYALECAIESTSSMSLHSSNISQETLDLVCRHKGVLTVTGLNEISDSIAAGLSKHQGDGLTIESKQKQLSETAAQHLGKYQGEWMSINCQILSPASAKYLCKFKGSLNLDKLKEIPTEDLAKIIIRDWGSGVSNLTSMTDPISKILSLSPTLDFEKLKTLSDKAALYLSAQNGQGCSTHPAWLETTNGFTLLLPEIKTLSDSAVESFCGYDTENAGIYLGGLTELSDAALKMFVACDLTIEYVDKRSYSRSTGRIALPVSFKKQVARIRKTLKKGEIEKRQKSVLTKAHLVKLKKLVKTKKPDNITVAANLLKSLDAIETDWDLIFSPTAISLLVNTWDIDVWNAVAEGIESNPKMYSDFNHLIATRFTQISSKEMKLAGVECNYWEETSAKQNGFLAAVINQIGEALAPIFCEVIVESYNLNELDMSNLQSISETAASIMSKCDSIDLSGLTTISDNAAEHLRTVAGLDLSGLTTWSDKTAKLLSETNGEWLKLSGLKTLTAPAARSLSQYQGDLDLSGLKKLTAEAAEYLIKYEGLMLVSSLSIVWDAK